MAFLRRLLILTFALALAAPAAAQWEEEDNDFGPLTTAEQEVLFEQGIVAYDAGDHARAFEIWLPLAQQGNMAAQRNVANMLRQGLGTEQDLPRAVYFYRRAADAGLVNAMVNLGAMLRTGQGIDAPDERAAARWFYRAAQAGDPRAQYVLGVMAARGEGMTADREAAVQLLRVAAAQGLRDANLRLAEAGLELVDLEDPEGPEFSLPPQLEPAPGESLAAYLRDPAPQASTPAPEPGAPAPALRLSTAGAQDETAPAESPGAPAPEEEASNLDRLLGGTR